MAAVTLFIALLGILSLFQVALALGAPWGRFVWGGRHRDTLPRRLRVGSASAVLIYGLIAMVALNRSGAIDLIPSGVASTGMWVIVILFGLTVIMNEQSPSNAERYTMTPIAAVLTVLALMIAL